MKSQEKFTINKESSEKISLDYLTVEKLKELEKLKGLHDLKVLTFIKKDNKVAIKELIDIVEPFDLTYQLEGKELFSNSSDSILNELKINATISINKTTTTSHKFDPPKITENYYGATIYLGSYADDMKDLLKDFLKVKITNRSYTVENKLALKVIISDTVESDKIEIKNNDVYLKVILKGFFPKTYQWTEFDSTEHLGQFNSKVRIPLLTEIFYNQEEEVNYDNFVLKPDFLSEVKGKIKNFQQSEEEITYEVHHLEYKDLESDDLYDIMVDIIQIDQFSNTGIKDLEKIVFEKFSEDDLVGGDHETTKKLFNSQIIRRQVEFNAMPPLGYVWYIKDGKGNLKRFKENFDTSD